MSKYNYDAVIEQFRAFPDGANAFIEKSQERGFICLEELGSITHSIKPVPVEKVGDLILARQTVRFLNRVTFRFGDLFQDHYLGFSCLHNVYLLDYIEDIYPAVVGSDAAFYGQPVVPRFSIPTSDFASFYKFDARDFNPDTVITGVIFGSKLRQCYNKVRVLKTRHFITDYSDPTIVSV